MNIDNMMISEEITIIEALDRLDKSVKKILFVVKDKTLVATITDGDIRRWILAKGNLEAKVKEVANYKPKYVNVSERQKAYSMLKQELLVAVPVLNDNHEIDTIIFEDEEKEPCVSEELRNVPVVIMAGGKGTRLYPYTKILPKPLIPVNDTPIIEHIINSFCKYGCRQFHLVVNHKKNMIKAYFAEMVTNYLVEYVDEEVPLGTGGGLCLLKGKIDSTFILTNCDILIQDNLVDIYNLHKKEGNIITMVCSAKNFVIPYGIVDINEKGEIKEMKEKPAISFLTNTGCYIVEPKVIEELEDNQMIGFPDIIEKYRQQGQRVGVYPISESSWLDMGQIDALKRMEQELTGEKA